MSLGTQRLSSYGGERPELRALVGAFVPRGATVIDVGCSSGAFGQVLQQSLGMNVIGIELDPDLASLAAGSLDRVLQTDAIAGLTTLTEEYSQSSTAPDAVVFGDVLEHLIDPWSAIDAAQELLSNGGHIVASIPNVAHIDTFANLLRGTWPMRDRGIHDDTHLRFFARQDVLTLMERNGAQVVALRRVFRLLEKPHRVNRIAPVLGRLWPNLFTFQYLAVATTPAGIRESA